MKPPAIGFIFHGVYGQHKTAASVAYMLRRDGWVTTITHDSTGNAIVWKKRRT